jgi:hypothetical protein
MSRTLRVVTARRGAEATDRFLQLIECRQRDLDHSIAVDGMEESKGRYKAPLRIHAEPRRRGRRHRKKRSPG